VLQCVAVCCSVLQCVAVCCSCQGQCKGWSNGNRHPVRETWQLNVSRVLLQCVAVWCSVLQCVAVCCSYKGDMTMKCVTICDAVCFSVLQFEGRHSDGLCQ